MTTANQTVSGRRFMSKSEGEQTPGARPLTAQEQLRYQLWLSTNPGVSFNTWEASQDWSWEASLDRSGQR
jgi:hypothetical protein